MSRPDGHGMAGDLEAVRRLLRHTLLAGSPATLALGNTQG